MASTIVKDDKDAYSSNVLPTRWKTLVGWMLADGHSIAINQGVCNTLDANMYTMSIANSMPSCLNSGR